MAVTNIAINLDAPDNSQPTFTLQIDYDDTSSTVLSLGSEGVLTALLAAATRAKSRADAAVTAAPPAPANMTPIL